MFEPIHWRVPTGSKMVDSDGIGCEVDFLGDMVLRTEEVVGIEGDELGEVLIGVVAFETKR